MYVHTYINKFHIEILINTQTKINSIMSINRNNLQFVHFHNTYLPNIDSYVV